MENTIAVKIKMQNGIERTGVLLIDKLEGILQNGFLMFVSNQHLKEFEITNKPELVEHLSTDKVRAVDSFLK